MVQAVGRFLALHDPEMEQHANSMVALFTSKELLELLGQLGVAELGAAFLLELLGDCAEGRVRRGAGSSAGQRRTGRG